MGLRKIVTVTREVEIQQLARKLGTEIFVADNPAEALEIVGTANPDLIIFDSQFTPDHIRQFLDKSLKSNNNSKNIPIIAVGNQDTDTKLSNEFIQAGACDYIRSKSDYKQLEKIVNRIKGKAKPDVPEEKIQNSFFVDDLSASVFMVGQSKAIRNTLKMIKLVAASRCNPVLIVGETGTGKELAAKAIHALRHPDGPFIAVNCAALTANLLESELFGHVKGSFTGADREKTGLLELADNGSLLLDEISEMPIDLQAKLLRVLQEKNFRKVGGTQTITTNATIIVSSNRNLQRQIQANQFRSDLYYRLNICPVTIAPLRSPHRREDIPLLAEYFLKNSTMCPEKKGKITSLTKLAIEALQKYDWPGNVRELSNTIERAILLETTDKIGLSSIIMEPPNALFRVWGSPIDPTDPSQPSETQTSNKIKDFSLEKAERKLITRALQETGWQKTRAAALLGITRATLYAKVKQYNIEKGIYLVKETADESQSPLSPETVTTN